MSFPDPDVPEVKQGETAKYFIEAIETLDKENIPPVQDETQ